MVFIRRFIGRKAHIAVDAKHALFGLQIFNIGVNAFQYIKGVFDQLFNIAFGGGIILFMGIEPRLVVVVLQIGQKLQTCFFEHGIMSIIELRPNRR